MKIKETKHSRKEHVTSNDSSTITYIAEQHHCPQQCSHHRSWYDTNYSWTEEDENEVLQSWANRTFIATCYKLTIQNDLHTRHHQPGPLYSFLENLQLHSMYNKSQKVLLGIPDRRPCVILAGDDFMFTPPPNTETTIATGTTDPVDSTTAKTLADSPSLHQLEPDDLEEDEQDEESGDHHYIQTYKNRIDDTKYTLDEDLWMRYEPTFLLRVVNDATTNDLGNTDDDDSGEDDNDEHEETIMACDEDQQKDDHFFLSYDDASEKSISSTSATVQCCQAVEHTTFQRRPSSIMMEINDDQQTCIDSTPCQEYSKNNQVSTATQTIDSSATSLKNKTSDKQTLSWRQWVHQYMVFITAICGSSLFSSGGG
ncbi:uncharacterized protein BX664DRAFT_30665 [Halteromyces radiatus]|uniref:uncharacterized protein n=1 Tax=Halteromyces radiatus TaxID=101107 RepID=UPI0022201B19|nr:uncharacterized protein BX664DRAFT_30665 [Halteromyces radiatus]KAI8099952.1 hypothetical protein BX664DRAFT_30665 [Halteromyces radiatus]